MRLSALLALALAASCARTPAVSATLASDDALPRARDLHARIITIDTHDDIPFNFATAEVDPLNADRQVNLEKMKAGGLDVGFFIVYVGQGPRTPEGNDSATARARTKFDAIHRMVRMYPDRIMLATSPDDVERAKREGKLAAAIGIENGYVIGKDLALIGEYHKLGARYMTLAHGRNNDVCDSSTDPDGPEHNGLSAFGREAVKEMNRVGMMVDISHVSRDCMMQATALSTLPVIASHSSTKAFADVPRNLDDDQLRAIARNGGVAQMVALAAYVKVDPSEKRAAIDSLRRAMGIRGGRGAMASLTAEQRAEYQSRMSEIESKWRGPNVADFVNHIDHAVKVAGIDHVGISSDFDGGGGITGWRDASETMNVTAELIRRGYSEADIRKLWGGNTLRVWRANRR
ncbi:MAG: dipeptidase [Gemmatimonadaceae bacterium]